MDSSGVAGSGADGSSNTHTNSLLSAFLDLCHAHLGVEVTRSDISAIHRIGIFSGPSGASSTRSTPVIVRFTSRDVRDSVYAARTSLRHHNSNAQCRVYINEHLTDQNAQLFKKARGLVRAKRIRKAWSFKGTVYIKVLDSDPPKRILCDDDFP